MPSTVDGTTAAAASPNANAVLATRVVVTPGWRCVQTTFEDTGRSLCDANTESDLEKRQVTYPSAATVQPDSFVATQAELERIMQCHALPDKASNKVVRYLRWNFFSMYRKLFTFVLAANLVAFVVFLSQLRHNSSVVTYGNAATAASANFCAGILMRNEHVVNLLFRLAVCIPRRAPLFIRRQAAKVYSYGGIHSSCGVSGSIWYFLYCALIINQYVSGDGLETALALTTGLTVILLLIILTFAHPHMRMRFHDHYEATHRFAGWAAVACLWLQTMVLVSTSRIALHRSFGKVLITTPSFWFLIAITLCIIYPWTRLRSRKVQVEQLSKHATRLHFDYVPKMETCVAVRLTDVPLKETHGFATIPNYKGTPGFSILISNAGDWTNKIITNPPARLWVKGAPTIGVMRVALMFKPVLVIATGSGIGPCLSLLQSHPDYQMRVIWSAQAPLTTYGSNVVTSVFRADPDAVIVDTKKTGRGNLLALAYSMYVESKAEAVIIISNPTVTRKVVYGLETRGVPAFGAIFDS